MMDSRDLRDRFEFHEPDEDKARAHTSVREVMHATAMVIDDLVPDGREKALAITKLEEAQFWANAALARAHE